MHIHKTRNIRRLQLSSLLVMKLELSLLKLPYSFSQGICLFWFGQQLTQFDLVLSFSKDLFMLCAQVFCCMYVYVPGAHGGQKQVSDSPDWSYWCYGPPYRFQELHSCALHEQQMPLPTKPHPQPRICVLPSEVFQNLYSQEAYPCISLL